MAICSARKYLLLISREYDRVQEINKVTRWRRSKENGNTQKYILEYDKIRPVADARCEELL